MTRQRRGFVLGKFMPPHRGHLFMCETAARLVDELTVLVCSTDAEPLPGSLRAAWMRELLPGCRVVHMHRDIPQTPDDHPCFWDIWRAVVREHHPQAIDRVFGSEPYVLRLAAELDAVGVVLDPARELFPCSGTAVREHPARHWRWLPAPVRRHYQRRLCLLGAESTGKSTLAAHLARRGAGLDAAAPPGDCAGAHMTEYGRAYDALYRNGSDWREADFRQLAATHRALREALAPHAGPLLVEDTDVVQTAVWSQMLGAAQAIDALDADFQPADLYLLLTPDVAWHDDGTRYHREQAERQRFHAACLALVRQHGLRHAVIDGGDWPARTAAAEHHHDALLYAVLPGRPMLATAGRRTAAVEHP